MHGIYEWVFFALNRELGGETARWKRRFFGRQKAVRARRNPCQTNAPGLLFPLGCSNAPAPHSRTVIGQEHIVGSRPLLRRAIESERIQVADLYGPAAGGKTSLAQAIADKTRNKFERLSAWIERRGNAASPRLAVNGLETRGSPPRCSSDEINGLIRRNRRALAGKLRWRDPFDRGDLAQPVLLREVRPWCHGPRFLLRPAFGDESV